MSVEDVKKRRDQLITNYLDTKTKIVEYEIILGQISAAILREIPAGSRHEVHPGVGVRIQGPPAAFTAAQARLVLTDAQYASICESVPSAKLAAKMLPGLLVDQCRVTGTTASIRSL